VGYAAIVGRPGNSVWGVDLGFGLRREALQVSPPTDVECKKV
jgi:hypothetical protein